MLSKVLRRTHMYLALVLTPWIALYALSTIAMNHRGEGEAPPFHTERTAAFEGSLPENAPLNAQAEMLLAHLGMEGAFNANRRKSDGALVIHRNSPLDLRRITYTPADRSIRIEKQERRAAAFLERLHRRRGYQHDFALEDVWAFSVAAVLVALVFWVVSGLWMWWEMKATRAAGAVAAFAGAAVFAACLAVL